MTERPQFVDAHSTSISVPPEEAYAAVRAEVSHLLGRRSAHRLGRLLRTQPRAGFEVVEEDPPRLLSLAGSHRFSRYVLDFRVEPGPDEAGSVVTAATYADFSGPLETAGRERPLKDATL